jgi:hypothetical protein
MPRSSTKLLDCIPIGLEILDGMKLRGWFID